MEQSTQKGAANAEESAAAAEEMNAQSEQLLQVAGTLSQMVGIVNEGRSISIRTSRRPAAAKTSFSPTPMRTRQPQAAFAGTRGSFGSNDDFKEF